MIPSSPSGRSRMVRAADWERKGPEFESDRRRHEQFQLIVESCHSVHGNLDENLTTTCLVHTQRAGSLSTSVTAESGGALLTGIKR